MRRRNWIIAAGAAAAMGAIYSSRHFIRGLQEGCWIPPPAPPRAENVSVSQETFRSQVLNADVGTVTIDAKPQLSGSVQPLLIFALPGRDGAAADHAARLHLADYLGAAVRRHGARGARMVVVDSGSSYWHARRSGEDRMKMLIEEIVLPRAGRNPQRGNFALIGWSMGAYGAILAAEKYPKIFGSVCGVSVAMWRSAREQMGAVPDAFDGAEDFERNDLRRNIAALKSTRVRLACGDGDPFLAADREFAAELRSAGTHPQIAFSPGCHDDNFWQRSAADDFTFLLGA